MCFVFTQREDGDVPCTYRKYISLDELDVFSRCDRRKIFCIRAIIELVQNEDLRRRYQHQVSTQSSITDMKSTRRIILLWAHEPCSADTS